MEALTRKEAHAFGRLTEEEREDYLRIRLYEEAEDWLEYFMTYGITFDRLCSRYLLRPPQM